MELAKWQSPAMAQAERAKITRSSPSTAETHGRMAQWRFPRLIRAVPKWVCWSGGGILAVIAALVIALYFLDWNALRGPIARYASQRMGREVRIEGDLHVKILSWQPRVDANGIWIANPKWLGAQPAADIGHLTFEFRLLPL